MPELTREQSLAQSADRHLAVTAGAGAGKTKVLVERFVHLLLDPAIQAEVRHITAITFTRKAAAEMKSRVSERLEEFLSDPAYKSKWSRIKSIRERFSSANISTIHSFCSSLLRDFPIEAGVNPNFTDLEDHEAKVLKEQAITEALEEWLEGSRPRSEDDNDAALDDERDIRRTEAQHVWMFFGKRDLIAALETLLASSERFKELQRLYAARDENAMLALINERFAERFVALLEEYLNALLSAFGWLEIKECSSNAQEHISAALTRIRSLLGYVEERRQNAAETTLSWQELERLWNDLAENFLGQGAISSKGGINGSKIRVSDKNCTNKVAYARDKARAERRYSELAKYAATIPNALHDAEHGRIIRILLRIAADAFAHIETQKKRLDALDFDDLQLKADALLDNPLVCEQIRRTTRFLMIDEFQDTNELQYRIVKKLIGNLGATTTNQENQEHVSASGINLFIVGDPKQSIYRFRGADVRVFAKAKADIQAANALRLASGEIGAEFKTPKRMIQTREDSDEAQGNINLRATFRLLPEIAAFVNGVSGRLMPASLALDNAARYDGEQEAFDDDDIASEYDVSEYDVEYNKIVCGGAAAEVQGSVRFLVAQSPSKDDGEALGDDEWSDDEAENITGNITEDIADDTALDDEGAAEEPFASEAQLLAEYLKAAVNGELTEPLFVRDSSGKARAPEYRDILILTRSRAKLEQALQALRREGVPFTVFGGRGYFEKQEILDIRSFLSFLQNSSDDAALAATLRSPFFCVSDSELYAASRLEVSALQSDSVDSLWERFCEYVAGAGQSSDAAAVEPSDDARRAVTILRRLLPLAAQIPIPALLRLIIEETGWRAMLVGSERFEQIEANIEKLLTIARGYENKGFRNLFDFAEELRRLSKYADKEGEADAQSSANAVRIMTIHAAKGLEAPIVALYNANARSGGQNDRLAFDAELGAAFVMKSSREDDGMMENAKTPLYALASREDDLAEQAEVKRLLYVALTRPKDHLIVSAECRRNANNSAATQGFFKMILESIGAATKNIFAEQSIACPPQELELLRGESQETARYSLEIPIIRARAQFLTDEALAKRFPTSARAKALNATADYPTSSTKDLTTNSTTIAPPNAVSEMPPLLLGKATAHIEGEYFSASQLQLFLADPEAYAHLYRLGLPPADEEGAFSGKSFGADDDGDRTLGTFAGESIHAVLERLPDWLSESGEIREESYKKVLSNAIPKSVSARSLSALFLSRLQREPHSVASSPLLRRYAAALGKAKYELPLVIPFGEDFLVAALDALVPTPPETNAQEAGEIWEVWDWKTNRVRTEQDMNALVERYRLQMEVYAYMVAALRPAQERIRVRLLFTRLAAQSTPDERWTRALDFGRDDIAAAERRIKDIIAKMRAARLG